MKAWLRSLDLIFDAKKLTLAARFLHTLHLLAKSALNIYECSHPTSYVKLCELLIRRWEYHWARVILPTISGRGVARLQSESRMNVMRKTI